MYAELYEQCLNANYIHVEESGDYCLQEKDNILYLFLQWSHGKEDWKNNFDFPARPYRDMPKTWRAHRGFVRVWKAIEPYVKDAILDPKYTAIIIVGYSHGAALTVLAHEYVWYNRPDIRHNCFSYAFEAPRVFCGCRPKWVKERWENCTIIRVNNDAVTHVPPALFGFKHVGTLLKVKLTKDELVRHTWFKFVDAHYPDNVLKAAKKLDMEQ